MQDCPAEDSPARHGAEAGFPASAPSARGAGGFHPMVPKARPIARGHPTRAIKRPEPGVNTYFGIFNHILY